MQLEKNKSKKRRKVGETSAEAQVKNKKVKNHEIVETSSTKEIISNEEPENYPQEQRQSNGNKKEKKKKKKRKIDETAENVIVEKKSKINDDAAVTSETTQNGAKSDFVDSDNEEENDKEDTDETKISNKEASKLSVKTLRKSFNTREGMDALRKFLAICKENKQRDLAAEYLQTGGSVLEILRLLDTSDKKNLNNACTVFAAMHLVIMKILSEYPQYQSNAEEACRHFINSHLSFVHSMLSSQSNAKHRKVVLRLLASMVSLGGNLPRELLAHLSFHSQVLETLSQQTRPTDAQSVRTCLIHFILAFLVEGNSTVIRALLEKRGMLSCIFPELAYDSHTTVHLVLNTVKTYVLENQAISKTSKLHVFSTPVMQNLVSLYNWKGPKNWPGPKGKKRDTSKDIVNPEEKEIAVEAVHDFLITILTSNRHGVIFHDRSLGTSGRKHNQLVNTVLQSLDRPWEHPRPLDLVVRVLVACPDLVRSQLNYTEPFLEPRASKKWILAVKFVGKLIESLNPENCLKPCLPELAGSQLISAVTNLTIPLIVLKSAIQPSMKDENAMIRHEAIKLLTKMLKQAKAFSTIVKENCHDNDYQAFRNSMMDYVSKNLPNLETILNIWNLALEEELDSTQEDIVDFIPNRQEKLSTILDFLEAYREICSESLDLGISGDIKASTLLEGLDNLPEIEKTNISRMKVKALKFLLAVDLSAFAPNENLFGKTLAFLITILDRVENAGETRETMKMLLGTSGMFEGCEEQMDIWINLFASLKLEEEKIEAASWFVKIVKQAIKRTDKYLGMIVEAEELAGEQHLNAGRLEDIFNDLAERDSMESRITNIAPSVAISPILCGAIVNARKNPNDDIARYLSYVTTLTLHCQVSPGTLINLARSVDNLPGKNYLLGFLPEKRPISIEDAHFIPKIVSKFSTILLSEENIDLEKVFEGERLVEFCHGDKKMILHHELEKYDIGILLRIAVFYMTQFVQRGNLEQTKFDDFKLCICALLHIAKSTDDLDFVDKCSRMIFTHPTILQYFSPIGKSKNSMEIIVTRGMIDICRTIVDICDSFTSSELFVPFKNKLLSQLRLAVKRCKNSGKLKNNSCPIEFVDILRPTNEETSDILKDIVELPKDVFLADKNLLSIWGNLVPKLLEMLTRTRNHSSRDSKVETTVVKKIVSYLTQLKMNRKISTQSWESNLQNYLKTYPHTIAGIDGHLFNCLMKLCGNSTTTSLVAFLVGRNDQHIPLFIRFVSNNNNVLAQSDLIFPILSSNLTHPWDKDFLMKIHSHYKDDVLRYFAEPANEKHWVSKYVEATIFLIDSCFESEDCAKACEIVLSNGDKLDNVDIGYVQLLESLFKKTSKQEENAHDALTKLVQVLIRIIVSALKKDSKNEEKLEKLCQSLSDTIKLLKTDNKDYAFEDLSKNYSWPQFTRFSLKLGLKIFKDNKKQVPLLRTLVNVCDIAYKDASENEYVKTLFEMTTSHSEFINIMLSSYSVKRDLLELLWVLVRKNHSTMSSSQIPLYLAAYNATLQESDQFILLILRHYETNGIKLNEYRPYLWGEAAATHYSVKGEADTALWRQPSTSQVLDRFSPEIVKETIKNFPVHRDMLPSGLCEAGQCYDPSFYLPLVTYLLSDNNVVACHKVTKSGALALVFAATGSSCTEIRLAAYTAISRFYFHLEATSSKEKPLWIRFIDALRNGINNTSSTLKESRMSCLVSTFLARASLVTTEPLNVLYSPLQAFLMAKPAMELSTIPELLQLFHSSEIEHRAHRRWILEVVRDGMKTSLDMDIALKCYLFKMIMDFYTSVLSDVETKRLILEIIESTVKIPKAGLLLARNHGLLVWLNDVSSNLTSRDIERIDIVISIVREILSMEIKYHDREAKFSLLNVLMSLKKCLSKNTSAFSYNVYTSSLGDIFQTKGFREALCRQDLTEILELGNEILGDVEDIVEILLHGGEFSGKMENSTNKDDAATIGRENLRKLVLIWHNKIAR